MTPDEAMANLERALEKYRAASGHQHVAIGMASEVRAALPADLAERLGPDVRLVIDPTPDQLQAIREGVWVESA